MAYKALRQMNVSGVTVEEGETITEAMDWPNVSAWLRNGFIEEVPDPEPAPKKKAAAPSRAPAKKSTAKKSTAKKTSTKTKE